MKLAGDVAQHSTGGRQKAVSTQCRYPNMCHRESLFPVIFTTLKLFGLKFSFARCLPPAEFSRKLQGGWERGRPGSFPTQD